MFAMYMVILVSFIFLSKTEDISTSGTQPQFQTAETNFLPLLEPAILPALFGSELDGLYSTGNLNGAYNALGASGQGYEGGHSFGKQDLSKSGGEGGFGLQKGFGGIYGNKGGYGNQFIGGNSKTFAKEKIFSQDKNFGSGIKSGFGTGYGLQDGHQTLGGYGGYGGLGLFGEGGIGGQGLYVAKGVGSGGFGYNGHKLAALHGKNLGTIG